MTCKLTQDKVADAVMAQVEVQDIVRMLAERAKRFGRWPAIQYRREDGPMQEVSWAEWLLEAQAVANALRALSVTTCDRVAILSRNCPEWLVADLGILMASAVTVPISPTVATTTVARILAETRPRALFLGSVQDLQRLEPLFCDTLPVPALVLFETPPDDWSPPGWTRGQLIRLHDFLVRGRAIRQRGDGLRPELSSRAGDTPATVVYTEGTSGRPRGLVISHQSIVARLVSLREVVRLPRGATQLLVLPLDSMFGRVMAWAAIDQGATTYLSSGRRQLREELFSARPYFLAGVPQFFAALGKHILTRREGPAGAPGRLTLLLTRRALDRATRRSRRRPPLRTRVELRVARQFLRTRVNYLLGGRIRYLVCGGALLDDLTAELFDLAGFPVLEGYGSCETIGVATANRPTQYRRNSVGLPLQGLELKLSTDGEILLRGSGLYSGYIQPGDAEGLQTTFADSQHPDGWYCTGDLGLMEDGFLFLTGRRKDIIKLHNGRGVAPEPIERALIAAGRLDHAVLCGEGQPFLTALAWTNQPRLDDGGIRRLLTRVNSSLGRHEQIRGLHLVEGTLSAEHGELSAHGEPIRPVIYERYRERIEQMYLPGQEIG